MRRLHGRGGGLGEAGAGLEDENRLLALLQPALPPVERAHAGQDVGAGGKPLADHCFGDLLRFGDAGCRAVEQDDAIGVAHMPVCARKARSWNSATATLSTSTAPAWCSAPSDTGT